VVINHHRDNSALIVIDGVVQAATALDALNPNDIASVNVLASSALYGSQGKNGAMVVTTKNKVVVQDLIGCNVQY
jgi:hypothetical protein